ncbi:hypothetical protein AB4396_06765 [Vibrio cyclitrophicus]
MLQIVVRPSMVFPVAPLRALTALTGANYSQAKVPPNQTLMNNA